MDHRCIQRRQSVPERISPAPALLDDQTPHERLHRPVLVVGDTHASRLSTADAVGVLLHDESLHVLSLVSAIALNHGRRVWIHDIVGIRVASFHQAP